MKSTITRHLATFLFLVALFSPEAFSQSVKYNGEAEVDVVATRHYASAQVGISTSHGAYFVNPKLFIGGGAMVGFNLDADFYKNLFPIFVDVRKDFSINRHFTTFIDAKVGHSFEGNDTGMLCDCGVDYGFYCYPSAGLRFSINDKFGVFVKLGYTYQAAKSSYFWIANGVIHSGGVRHNAGGFSASLGFSF